MHFCVWFCIFQAVHDADLEQKFTFFTEEIWFHTSGYVGAENYKYWSGINPTQILEAPLYDQKVSTWCAITGARIVGPMFSKITTERSAVSHNQ
jgi:hypothetical protein